MIQPHSIEPRTRLITLFRHYPALKKWLLDLLPAGRFFRTFPVNWLITPFLSIRQVAQLTGIPLDYLWHKIAKKTGTEAGELFKPDISALESTYLSDCPAWMESVAHWTDFVIKDCHQMPVPPIKTIEEKAQALMHGEALRVISDCLMVPLIERLKTQHYLVWAEKDNGVYYVYICQK
jgi:TusA-related sulfurtransferase